jgi:hypothetical protein
VVFGAIALALLLVAITKEIDKNIHKTMLKKLANSFEVEVKVGCIKNGISDNFELGLELVFIRSD